MKQTKIIPLSAYLPEPSPEPFDYAGYNERARRRYRRAAACSVVLTAVESAVTAAIGLCVLAATMVFFTML